MTGLREWGSWAKKKVDENVAQGIIIWECYYLHKTASYPFARWLGTTVFAMIYGIRVFYFVHGFYFITYTLVYALLFLIFKGLLKPWVPPEAQNSDAPILPVKAPDDEFKPFSPMLPEFKCWQAANARIFIAFVITFFPVFTVVDPFFNFYQAVLASILVFIIFMVTSIAHMKKYKYVPFTFGKKKYGGKKHATSPTPSSDAN